jgi:Leucine-rich repeat (LRR) protein
VGLNLTSRGLTGTLSPAIAAIGNLTFLRTLNLTFNWFEGSIPLSIGHLVRLRKLDLSNNMPASLSSCVSLTFLGARTNQLHDRIPVEFGRKLTNLRILSLGNNSLTCYIPVSLANMSSLHILDLRRNQLEGPIPTELGSIGGLRLLYLQNNNLSGVLPHSLYNLSMLQDFFVNSNSLSGTIPTNIGDRFPNIETLNFCDNKFHVTIPVSLSNLSALMNIQLSKNNFWGPVPPTLGRSKGLHSLMVYDNKLEANED